MGSKVRCLSTNSGFFFWGVSVSARFQPRVKVRPVYVNDVCQLVTCCTCCWLCWCKLLMQTGQCSRITTHVMQQMFMFFVSSSPNDANSCCLHWWGFGCICLALHCSKLMGLLESLHFHCAKRLILFSSFIYCCIMLIRLNIRFPSEAVFKFGLQLTFRCVVGGNVLFCFYWKWPRSPESIAPCCSVDLSICIAGWPALWPGYLISWTRWLIPACRVRSVVCSAPQGISQELKWDSKMDRLFFSTSIKKKREVHLKATWWHWSPLQVRSCLICGQGALIVHSCINANEIQWHFLIQWMYLKQASMNIDDINTATQRFIRLIKSLLHH